MQTCHTLRKYDPAEWGGTETAVLRLVKGLRALGVSSAVHCPRIPAIEAHDPFTEAGIEVSRFQSFLPVLGISREKREQLVRWGGNIMSFQLYRQLVGRRPDVIHTHALNRLAGVSLLAARRLNVPLVVTIHGGALDLAADVMEKLTVPLRGGFEWGKALGLFVQSRSVLAKADAVLACNPREAELCRQRFPRQRVVHLQHSVPAAAYAKDRRSTAQQAFPMIEGRDVLLCVARLDPVKNQGWLLEQLPAVLQRHPRALLVLAGPATCDGYGEQLQREIHRLGLGDHVLLTGGLEQGSDTLVGLMQHARAMLLPSVSETFGLTILEAWAAGTPILSSRTSGACSLITPQENGWLFGLDSPAEFHASLDEALAGGESIRHILANASVLVQSTYDSETAAARVKALYEELHAARRQKRMPHELCYSA